MDTYIIETREFNWKLHNFTNELLPMNKSAISEEFSIFLGSEETKWNFSIESRNGIFGIYLYLKETESDDFTVNLESFVWSLTNQKFYNIHLFKTRNEFRKLNLGWGWSNFISQEIICNNTHFFLKGNTLTLGLKIVMSKKKESELVNRKLDNQYQKMCKEYFDTKSLSDFTIVCSDGIKIQAHKFILAGFSSVMKTMIDIKMAESKNNSINIKDINGETMTEILRFIYTTKVNNINKLAGNLLYGAEKYELSELKKFCVESMIENLSIDNALDYFIFADKYNSKALLFRSAVFIKQNYTTLRNKNWTKFSKDHFFTLMDNYQHIPGEVKILESTLITL